MRKKELVVILIFAHKDKISYFEEISLRQCYKILGSYPIRLVCPIGLDTTNYQRIIPSIKFDRINPKWQSSYYMYNRLKTSPFLYRRYRNYEFLLTYELDAFVFRDELKEWCLKKYDYIGAPWFEGKGDASKSAAIIGVGNSGFSLRNIEAALKSLHTFAYLRHPKDIWQEHEKAKTCYEKMFRVARLFKKTTISNNSYFMLNDFNGNEDVFWGEYIGQTFDWFKLSPVDEAIKFSFEVNSRLLYEKNAKQLPFGCHAWWKYDLEFWLPHIQEFGYLE